MFGNTTDGFRYVADRTVIGPYRMELAAVRAGPSSLTWELVVLDDGDATSYYILPAVGQAPTPGALAYLIPEAETALLFPADSLWQPADLPLHSMADSLTQAVEDYGQTLSSTAPNLGRWRST